MPTFEALDWYDAPRYYDIIFDVDTGREADFLEAAYRRFSFPKGKPKSVLKVLEPACGSGRLVLELARRGAKVTGFDASQPMLDFASSRLKSKNQKAQLFLGRMEAFEAGSGFDLAHCLVSTFRYLASESAARDHLDGVARALRPGGIYVLGLHLSDYRSRSLDRERWLGRRGRTQVVCNIQGWPPDPRTRTEQVRSRLRVVEGKRERRLETRWVFRTYDVLELRRLLRSVPELELAASFDFTYAIECPMPLDGEQLDVLLILRRRGPAAKALKK